MFTLDNLCLKENSPPSHFINLDKLLGSINPCLVLTPLDCFWEGSFVHQPVHPVQFNICDTSWANNVSWSNVNVTEALKCVKEKDTFRPPCSTQPLITQLVKISVEEVCVCASVRACVHVCACNQCTCMIRGVNFGGAFVKHSCPVEVCSSGVHFLVTFVSAL